MTSLLFSSRPWVSEEQTVFVKFTTAHFALLHIDVLWCDGGVFLREKWNSRVRPGFVHLPFVKYLS